MRRRNESHAENKKLIYNSLTVDCCERLFACQTRVAYRYITVLNLKNNKPYWPQLHSIIVMPSLKLSTVCILFFISFLLVVTYPTQSCSIVLLQRSWKSFKNENDREISQIKLLLIISVLLREAINVLRCRFSTTIKFIFTIWLKPNSLTPLMSMKWKNMCMKGYSLSLQY